MKEFLNQGAAKAQELGSKGFEAGKDFLGKAGEKAQNLGEKGILVLEIKQLNAQAEKLLAKLGNEVYARFAEQGDTSISSGDAAIKSILAELAVIKEGIDKREKNLR
jgi:hypothetical protein